MDSEEIQSQRHFEELIQGLIDNTYGCCNDFLSPETIQGLLHNLQNLSDTGMLQDSGIGNQLNYQRNLQVRGDRINWIDALSKNPFELMYLTKVQQFINHLNKTRYKLKLHNAIKSANPRHNVHVLGWAVHHWQNVPN